MDFFSGVAGFFLSMGNWVAPVTPSDLSVEVLNRSGGNYHLRSHLEFNLTDDAAALVDAGVPLQVRYLCRTENETIVMIRTLRSDLANRTYVVADSVGKRSITTKTVGNVFVAARQFRMVGWEIDTSISRVEILAEILAVTVPRLDRTVDVSSLFGGKRFSKTLIIDRKDFK